MDNDNIREDSNCRICHSEVREVINLGSSSPANNFVEKESDLSSFYPLIVDLCSDCLSIQLRHCLDQEILYKDYTYMTPDVSSLTKHYEDLIELLKAKDLLGTSKRCLEVGSNTGLFIDKLSPHVEKIVGIDPAENIVKVANDLGRETVCDFFNKKSSETLLSRYGSMDLIIARHMFAHNEDPKILLEAMDEIISPRGSIMIENAYAIPTLLNGEFDQIYHEHMFYYSVINMQNLLKTQSFELFDLMHSKIHGGSITFLAAKIGEKRISSKIEEFMSNERDLFKEDKIFKEFNKKILEIKVRVLNEINEDKSQGKLIAAYGASAKAFTMFSYLGLDNSVISYCVDTTPTKINKYFPGFGIRVVDEEAHMKINADTIIVTAWNYKEHIMEKSKDIFKKGTKLIFPLPEFEVQIVE